MPQIDRFLHGPRELVDLWKVHQVDQMEAHTLTCRRERDARVLYVHKVTVARRGSQHETLFDVPPLDHEALEWIFVRGRHDRLQHGDIGKVVVDVRALDAHALDRRAHDVVHDVVQRAAVHAESEDRGQIGWQHGAAVV